MQAQPSDIEIARACQPGDITTLAETALGIPAQHLEPYGRDKAKIDLDYLESLAEQPDGKLVLVTAISPTPAGEGKTTTSVGLHDALCRLGEKSMVCLREPSLGPCFGMKGGAAGGGYAQVIPMEDINLHFTGDFHAVALAHNLLAAMLDNHIHHGNELEIDARQIVWKRVIDMNDRALRSVTVGLGGKANGFPREDGYDIVVASEVMAILCLVTSLQDLRQRLGDIVVAYTRRRKPITARDLKADGPMTVLLRKAVQPNLVQTLEGRPALVHGGPFANIAHGCNSVIATRAALKLADFVVTEAGFGADLGAEKFIDIKCRKSGLRPDLVVLVATLRALRYHGGAPVDEAGQPDPSRLERGCCNLERHLEHLTSVFGLRCVVALNRFSTDTPEEIELVRRRVEARGVPLRVANHWAEGGAGALDLARTVREVAASPAAPCRFAYGDELSLIEKVEAVATSVYGAATVTMPTEVRREIGRLETSGYGRLPVCIAKTQYSFSIDPKAIGAPSGHELTIRGVRLAAGAGFVVVLCGDIMTLPGLPKRPAAEQIDIDSRGQVVGLF